MSEQNREKRAVENREASLRPQKWTPPQLLPDPTPEPGYAFRWIRISMMNDDDPRNISSKLREGWEPVKASDHPEIRLFGAEINISPTVLRWVVCCFAKTPVEFVEQRDQYYNQQSETQLNSVDNNFMRESDPRMPMFKERKSTVTFGKGN